MISNYFCPGNPSVFGVFDFTYAPTLIFYAYIPIILVSLFFGALLIYKDKYSLQGKLILLLSLFFSLWNIDVIAEWVTVPVNLNHFFWQLTMLFEMPISLIAIYLAYVFLNKRDISSNLKITLLLFFLPVPLLLPTVYNIGIFDVQNCQPTVGILTYYVYAFELFAIVWIIVAGYRARRKETDRGRKKQILLMLLGICLFLLTFSLSNIFGQETQLYQINLIGPIGMVVFLALMTYMIVRFKAFNVKLLGTQALVWSQIILIGSEFFFIQTDTNRILTAITLVISAWLGLVIVRSVKKEIAQKEMLEIANKGQENLIHIMNHQIKGFLGTARSIFAEFLEGGVFGRMPESATPALKRGFQATTDGVNYVQDILRGESALKGKLMLDMKPMDVKVIVEELIAEMKPMAEENKLMYEETIAPGEYQIIGDRGQLKEAFKNLITNAIRYNDPHFEHKGVKISLSRIGDKIIFSVRDTGNGISKEDEVRLFTPGGVGHDSVKQNADATGYGLSFVKGAVLSHNGKVYYKPNTPEKGTTFFIELPTGLSK